MKRLERRRTVVDDDWSVLQHCLAAIQTTGNHHTNFSWITFVQICLGSIWWFDWKGIKFLSKLINWYYRNDFDFGIDFDIDIDIDIDIYIDIDIDIDIDLDWFRFDPPICNLICLN